MVEYRLSSLNYPSSVVHLLCTILPRSVIMYYIIYQTLTSTSPCTFGGITILISIAYSWGSAHVTAPEGCTFQNKAAVCTQCNEWTQVWRWTEHWDLNRNTGTQRALKSMPRRSEMALRIGRTGVWLSHQWQTARPRPGSQRTTMVCLRLWRWWDIGRRRSRNK